jgi:anti-anti-sigma regulatory factor
VSLAKLISMHRKRRAMSQVLRLIGVQPLTMEVFRITHLDRVLEIVDPPA